MPPWVYAVTSVGSPPTGALGGPLVKVPLTVTDFLDRAELVYGDRIGVVDEPDQPAESWGELTYARIAELARAQAAGLDAARRRRRASGSRSSRRTRPGC